MLRLPRRAVLAVCLCVLPAAAQAAEGLDAVFAQAFPGATVDLSDAQSYDEVDMLTGPMKARFEAGPVETREGRVLSAHHIAPAGHSTLEVFRAYRDAVEAAGFAEVFTCKGEEGCGGLVGYVFQKRNLRNQSSPDVRFGTWERTAGGVSEMVSVVATMPATSDPERMTVSVVLQGVSSEAEQAELETLDADGIASAIADGGTAVIYGLEFETDSAELLPASDAVVAEMAGYLTANPGVEILLVGHTDNAGALDYNMDLSRRRAAAVRDALVEGHGIAAGRLGAHGVGFLAPKAPNATDAGRAANRRVEMVAR